jgi:DNA-directed RNA polymerase subunit H (RpoH/RPB5)
VPRVSDTGLSTSFETSLTLDATRVGPSERVEKLVVLFGKEKILGVVAITELSKYLKQASLQHVILITAQGFTAFAQGPLNKLRAQYSVRTFVHDELLVNVTKHILVKPHVKLGDNERVELLRKYKIDNDPEQLPKLMKTDPIALYYNFNVGDIVAISNVGTPTNYRLVVNKMT